MIRIEPFIGKSLIKVITGQRRIGKSYILLQVADRIRQKMPDAHLIFIDKEQLTFADIKNEAHLYHYVKSHLAADAANYLFVDEVQEIANTQVCSDDGRVAKRQQPSRHQTDSFAAVPAGRR